MRTNQKLIGIFVLAILLVPLAAASETVNTSAKNDMHSKSYHFSSNDSKVLAQVWGKDITVAEYMETVYPGSLEALPEDIVKTLKEEPMVWTGIDKATTGGKITNTAKSSESKGGNSILDAISTVYTSSSYSTISPTVVQGQLHFGGFTLASAPVQSIIVNSALHRDNGVTPISTTSTIELGSASAFASSVVAVSGHHTYFSQSQHQIIWPAGCIPSSSTAVTVSSITTT